MATATNDALADVKKRHGDINTFVAKELDYPRDLLKDAFALNKSTPSPWRSTIRSAAAASSWAIRPASARAEWWRA